ncbi:MAG: helix-turn-helix domain-containing protein [Kiritimatiellae bacterium]|nr:helix-turn-helix domain-containing protein [Kiritimatiellia bacterium]
MKPGYLRKNDAAQYLGISERTLNEWMARRLIPFAKVSHRVCLFKVAEIDAAIEKITVRARKAVSV